ncbi:hypothetical protein GCM10023086_09130 [Streptomyces venetus]|uniref:Uncharacterized protein n=1 Tax=Streptomyces venetus TaxID=1701086 RepID=A0ABP8F5X8_9ACTN
MWTAYRIVAAVGRAEDIAHGRNPPSDGIAQGMRHRRGGADDPTARHLAVRHPAAPHHAAQTPPVC